jgi:elongator complex protein 1
MEKKKGKKGTVDEEEYIIASFGKLMPRLEHLQGMGCSSLPLRSHSDLCWPAECSKLLPLLFIMRDEHKAAGISLQERLLAFQIQLEAAVGEVWLADMNDTKEAPSDHPPRPSFPALQWQVRLLQM